VLFIRGNDRDNSVNILRNLIRKYLSNPPDSRFQNIGSRAVIRTVNYSNIRIIKLTVTVQIIL
jgi:hypothetical protein